MIKHIKASRFGGRDGLFRRVLAVGLILTFLCMCVMPVSADQSSDFTVVNGALEKYNGSGGNIVIPDTVTSMPSTLFTKDTTVTSITIPKSVTSIAEGVLVGALSCTAINVASDNPDYCSIDGALYNKDQTTLLAYPAAKSGSTFKIPDTVKRIGQAAFAFNTNLTSVTGPDTMTEIGSVAFGNCGSLTSYTLPSSLKKIGTSAFNGTGLTSLTIPAGCTSVVDNSNGYDQTAFMSMDDLQTINVAAGNTAYKSVDGILYSADESTLLAVPEKSPSISDGSFTIPEGVKKIDDYAFYKYTLLKTVSFPSTLTEIGNYAFYSSSLTGVTMPAVSALATIGECAFQSSALTGITLPDSVTNIGYSAFQDAPLSTINISPSSKLTTIGSGALNVSGNLTTLFLPSSVTSINSNNLKGKTGLTVIAYSGTYAATWAAGQGITTKTVSVDSDLDISNGELKGFASGLTATPSFLIIPDTVKSIDDYAFVSKGIYSAYIPGSVTSIGENSFSGNSSLVILTPSGSYAQTYASSHKINYTNQSTPGYKYSAGGSSASDFTISSAGILTAYTGTAGTVYIPDTVKLIAMNTFSTCKTVKRIVVPSSVTKIMNNALAAPNLTSVHIESSATSLMGNPFGTLTGVTVYAPAGSAAETFASSHSLAFIDSSTLSTPTAYDVYTTHSGTVEDPNDSNELDDQIIHFTMHFSNSISITDSDSVCNELLIQLNKALTYNATKNTGLGTSTYPGYATAAVGSDGKSLEISVHVGFAVYAGYLTVTAPNGVSSITDKTTGEPVTWSDTALYVPNGTTLKTTNVTAGNTEKGVQASTTKQIVVNSECTRAMIHMLFLKNGKLVGTQDSYGSNLTTHYHLYLDMDSASDGASTFASLVAGFFNGTFNSQGYSATANGDKVTITDSNSTDGEALDLLVYAYPRDRTQTTDKTALESEITAAQAVSTDGYTEESVTALNNTIAAAKAMDDSDYYLQTEVDAETQALKDAVNDLTKSVVSSDQSVTVDYTDSAIPEGKTVTTVNVSDIGSGTPSYQDVTALLKKDGYQSLLLNNIQLLDAGGDPITHLNGTVTVKIKIPKGTSSNGLKVFWYNPDATDGAYLTDMNATVENGYLVFKTNHFSYYVLAQPIKTSSPSSGSNSDSGTSSSKATETVSSENTSNTSTGSGSGTSGGSSPSTFSASNPYTGGTQSQIPGEVILFFAVAAAAGIILSKKKS